MAIGSPPTDLPPRELFLAHLPTIEKVIRHFCRRHYFSREKEEDLASTVRIKLLENDHAIIRKFRGESSFGTYITLIVQNLAKDYQNQRWGKWRPSAEARRLGAVAIRLDELLNRDGCPFDQACEILWTNHQVKQSWKDLLKIAERLPQRTPRPPEEEIPEDVPDPSRSADDQLLARERAETWRRVMASLDRILTRLPAEDRVLIKMKTEDDFSIAEISRSLKLDQKPLYRRIKRILLTLRKALEEEGICKGDVEDILESDGF